MEKTKQEQPKELRNWGTALPIGGMAALLVFGVASCTHDKLTISTQEVEDAIYAKYGQCLAGTTYALGEAAVEYASGAATAHVIPAGAPESVLMFDVERSISNLPLPRPDDATEVLLADMSCEIPKSFWQG